MTKRYLLPTLLLSLALQANTSFADQAQDIQISSAFAREIPPGAPASAGFMTLKNSSDKDVKIVSANSDVATFTELHTHTNDNGVMRMREIPFILIPANGKTELKPGGLHIMLIQPVTPIKQGNNVNITLTFEDKSTKDLSIPVKRIMGMHGHHKRDF